jgi:adenylyl-sulfate kinase
MSVQATVLWFTGMSGAGKSTLANGLRDALQGAGRKVLILDGDDVRTRLHRHLGFTPKDIRLNNELIVGLCEQHRADHDYIIVPIISPYRDSRAAARRRLSPDFHEIYVHAALDVLHDRDTKGLYGAARRKEIDNLIGVSPSSPYDVPAAPDLQIDTGLEDLGLAQSRLLYFALDCRAPTGRRVE